MNIRELYPEHPFEAYGVSDCNHPTDRLFMHGWSQVCGRCGMARAIA